jgi:hypothetical protein
MQIFIGSGHFRSFILPLADAKRASKEQQTSAVHKVIKQTTSVSLCVITTFLRYLDSGSKKSIGRRKWGTA